MPDDRATAQRMAHRLVPAANLIDRLPDPGRFLATIAGRIVSGGVRVAGERRSTLEGLHLALDRHFRLVAPPRSTPFVIREAARTFQHSRSEVTVWERRGVA